MMGSMFPAISPEHEDFIRKQRMFFVATAPADGHINLSPKGYETFRVLSPNEAAYLDLTGSGNETSAHLDENGRITLMFMSFGAAPEILRLYGTGRTVLPESAEWDDLIQGFKRFPGERQIIRISVTAVKTSCGYSVPKFSYEGERETLKKWAAAKNANGLTEYRKTKNAISMDGRLTPLGRTFEDNS